MTLHCSLLFFLLYDIMAVTYTSAKVQAPWLCHNTNSVYTGRRRPGSLRSPDRSLLFHSSEAAKLFALPATQVNVTGVPAQKRLSFSGFCFKKDVRS